MLTNAALTTMTPAQVSHAYLEDLSITTAQYIAYQHVRSLHVGPFVEYPTDVEAQAVAREMVSLLPNPSYM